jgi:hypothetical protein
MAKNSDVEKVQKLYQNGFDTIQQANIEMLSVLKSKCSKNAIGLSSMMGKNTKKIIGGLRSVLDYFEDQIDVAKPNTGKKTKKSQLVSK